jgi:hypothetical protein
MDELIEMLHDFVELTTRAKGGTDDTLTAQEKGRVLALTRMLPGDGAAPGPDADDGDQDGIPVQLTAPGGFETARLIAVSRDGMRLHLAHPIAAGTTTIVRVIAPSVGVEFAFPCRVAWCDADAIGLLFDGAPTKVPLAIALGIGWQRPLDLRTGWGRRPVLAAA